MFSATNLDRGGKGGGLIRQKSRVRGAEKHLTFKVVKPTERLDSPSKHMLVTEIDEHEQQSLTGKQRNEKAAKFFANDDGIGGIEEGRRTKLEFQKLQIIDISVTVAAIVGALLTVLTYDLEFDRTDDDTLKILLYMSFCSTLVAIVLDIARYLQKLKYLKETKTISKSETLYSSGQIWNLMVEIILLLIQPYPWLIGEKVIDHEASSRTPFYYNINDIFSVIMGTRVYLLVRVFLNNTDYRSPRSRRLGALYGADNNYLFAYKCLMKESPFVYVTVLLGGSIFVFGYMLRICERPLSRVMDADEIMDFHTYWNSMWCIILTMTTVGYGDYYPRTHYGRIVTFLCCIWGVFVVSLVVVTLSNTLSMSDAEEKVLIVLQRLKLRSVIKQEAVDVLTNMTRISLNNRRKKAPEHVIEAENNKIVKDIQVKLHDFKHHTRQIKALENSMNISEEMTRQFEFMRDEIKDIKTNQQGLQLAVERLTDILESTNRTVIESKIVESMTRVPDHDNPTPSKLPPVREYSS